MGYKYGAVDYTKDSWFFLDGLNELHSIGFGNDTNFMMTVIDKCQDEDFYNINQCNISPTHFVDIRDAISGVICAQDGNETSLEEHDYIALSETAYGKVLIKNRYGQVGYICTDLWDYEKANLTCNQAGYEIALAFTEYSMRNQDFTEYTFVMSHVDCNIGYIPHISKVVYEKIQDCSYHARNVTCQKAIAGAVCKDPTKDPALVYLEENGHLRAINENYKLGAICAQHWSDKAADIACKTLGYETFTTWGQEKVEKEAISFDSIDCSVGNFNHLLECNKIANVGWCLNNEIVTLSCI